MACTERSWIVTVHEMLGKDFVEAVIFDWREAG